MENEKWNAHCPLYIMRNAWNVVRQFIFLYGETDMAFNVQSWKSPALWEVPLRFISKCLGKLFDEL